MRPPRWQDVKSMQSKLALWTWDLWTAPRPLHPASTPGVCHLRCSSAMQVSWRLPTELKHKTAVSNNSRYVHAGLHQEHGAVTTCTWLMTTLCWYGSHVPLSMLTATSIDNTQESPSESCRKTLMQNMSCPLLYAVTLSVSTAPYVNAIAKQLDRK